MSHSDERVQIRNPADAATLFRPLLAAREQEHFVLALLNTKNEVLGVEVLYKGSLKSSAIRVGEVYREAVRRQAAAIVVAHNHPSGSTEPSPEDIRVTRDLRRAGELLDIELLDPLIVTNQSYVSLKERGLGF